MILKIEDYAEDFVDSDWFQNYADESYWQDNFSVELCMQQLGILAEQNMITLTGIEDFDYDKFFYYAYECTEKGLS